MTKLLCPAGPSQQRIARALVVAPTTSPRRPYSKDAARAVTESIRPAKAAPDKEALKEAFRSMIMERRGRVRSWIAERKLEASCGNSYEFSDDTSNDGPGLAGAPLAVQAAGFPSSFPRPRPPAITVRENGAITVRENAGHMAARAGVGGPGLCAEVVQVGAGEFGLRTPPPLGSAPAPAQPPGKAAPLSEWDGEAGVCGGCFSLLGRRLFRPAVL